jgi:hypothetical protein
LLTASHGLIIDMENLELLARNEDSFPDSVEFQDWDEFVAKCKETFL